MDLEKKKLARLRWIELEQGWKKVADLREECKYRGLPHTGKKVILMERLYQADREKGTPDGRKLDYERCFNALKKARLAAIVPFPWFNKFLKKSVT